MNLEIEIKLINFYVRLVLGFYCCKILQIDLMDVVCNKKYVAALLIMITIAHHINFIACY